MRHEVLAAGGIDVDDALERMMGSESLLLRLLRLLPPGLPLLHPPARLPHQLAATPRRRRLEHPAALL